MDTCARCGKPVDICICAGVEPLPTKLRVLVLQHPQEPDVLLGTAKLATLALSGAVLKVGLSWPNLAAALGEPAQPSKWAVLFLGGKDGERPAPGRRLLVRPRKGSQYVDPSTLEGIVALDGTWAQAKTLWWRNAWLLKLHRAVLAPARPSLYGSLRREPRRECLSTLEAVALTLTELGEPPTTEAALLDVLGRQLTAVRTSRKSPERPGRNTIPASTPDVPDDASGEE